MLIKKVNVFTQTIIHTKIVYQGMHKRFYTDVTYCTYEKLEQEFKDILYLLKNIKKMRSLPYGLEILILGVDTHFYKRYNFLINHPLVFFDKNDFWNPKTINKKNIKIFLIKWKLFISKYYTLYNDAVKYQVWADQYPNNLIIKISNLRLKNNIQNKITLEDVLKVAKMFALYTNKAFPQENSNSIYQLVKSYLKYDFK